MQWTTEAFDVHKPAERQVHTLSEMLQAVPDKRGKRGRRYEAVTVLVILLLAKLAGEQSISGIAQ
jgi:hypothetical protein